MYSDIHSLRGYYLYYQYLYPGCRLFEGGLCFLQKMSDVTYCTIIPYINCKQAQFLRLQRLRRDPRSGAVGILRVHVPGIIFVYVTAVRQTDCIAIGSVYQVGTSL